MLNAELPAIVDETRILVRGIVGKAAQVQFQFSASSAMKCITAIRIQQEIRSRRVASFQLFTAPAVRPVTRYFCMKKPITIRGTMAMVAAILLFPQSTEIAPT